MKPLSEALWGALRILNNAQGSLIPSPTPRVVGARRSRPAAAFFALVKRGYAEKRMVEGRAFFKITPAGYEAIVEHERQEMGR